MLKCVEITILFWLNNWIYLITYHVWLVYERQPNLRLKKKYMQKLCLLATGWTWDCVCVCVCMLVCWRSSWGQWNYCQLNTNCNNTVSPGHPHLIHTELMDGYMCSFQKRKSIYNFSHLQLSLSSNWISGNLPFHRYNYNLKTIFYCAKVSSDLHFFFFDLKRQNLKNILWT